MANTSSNIPSAWDDDWYQVADTKPSSTTSNPTTTSAITTTTTAAQPPPQILSRAQRKVQHHLANKKLWETADAPPVDVPIFIQSRNAGQAHVPSAPYQSAKSSAALAQSGNGGAASSNSSNGRPLGPAGVKVLARKPPAKTASPVGVGVGVGGPQSLSGAGNARHGNGSGGGEGIGIVSRQPVLQDEEDDSEAEEQKAEMVKLKARQERAARERIEKQRKYNEVRERLFGTPSNNPDAGYGVPETLDRPQDTGGTSSPLPPLRPNSSNSSNHNGNSSNRRGAYSSLRSGGGSRHHRGNSSNHSPSNAHGRSAVSSPNPTNQTRTLYDPNESSTPRPKALSMRGSSSTVQQSRAAISTPEIQPSRQPRGPDGTGRGFDGAFLHGFGRMKLESNTNDINDTI